LKIEVISQSGLDIMKSELTVMNLNVICVCYALLLMINTQ